LNVDSADEHPFKAALDRSSQWLFRIPHCFFLLEKYLTATRVSVLMRDEKSKFRQFLLNNYYNPDSFKNKEGKLNVELVRNNAGLLNHFNEFQKQTYAGQLLSSNKKLGFCIFCLIWCFVSVGLIWGIYAVMFDQEEDDQTSNVEKILKFVVLFLLSLFTCWIVFALLSKCGKHCCTDYYSLKCGRN
jgi:hypothetical protein